MKTSTLKKSLLDYALKGNLTAKFRRENTHLNAYTEIQEYNHAIQSQKDSLEKQIQALQKALKKLKSTKSPTQEEIQKILTPVEKIGIKIPTHPQNLKELKYLQFV